MNKDETQTRIENVENDSPKIMSFVGDGRSDLPYFISLFLNGAGKKVLLIDNTKEQYLYSAVSERAGEDTQIIPYLPDLFIANNAILKKEDNTSVFDVIIQIWGDNYEHYREGTPAEYVFIENCYNMQKNKKLKSFVNIQDFGDAEINFIFRDKVDKHFNEKMLEADYGIEAAGRYIIPADIQDLYSYQILLAQGIISFRKADLSGGLYNAVVDIAAMLYEFDDKELKQIENRLLKEIKKNKRNGGQK